jgi:competence protein ComEC
VASGDVSIVELSAQLSARRADSGCMTREGSGPLAAAIALATGVALGSWIGALAIAAAAVALVGVRRWLPAATWLAAVLAIGAVRGAPRPVAVPDVVIDDRGIDRVAGVVRGPILHGASGDGAVLETDGAPVWLWAPHLVPGERVAALGAVRTPRGLRDPGVTDRGDATRARGAELELTARSVERLGDDAGLLDRAWRWAAATQARWVRAIDAAGGDPVGGAALRGIAAGDRGEVSPALDQRWRTVGIFHVLSVSGLHLAIVAGLAFGLLRRLIVISPWGGRCRPARWAAPPALVLAIAYTMITGAQLATLRALIVIALVLIAQLVDRPLRLLDAIGVAAIVILLWRPADLFDPSFQLSFVAGLTLALAPVFEARGVRGWLLRGVTGSALVALTTAPLTAYHFHQVAAGGVIGNLVLTPLVELVALPLGLAGVLLGASPLIAAAAWIVGLADRGAGLLAEVTPVGHVVLAGATIMAALVALSLVIAAGRLVGRRRTVGWLALCALWAFGRSPPPAGALRVTFLDVGQGDAALLELPDDSVWLIDAGGNASARDLAQAAAPGRAIDRVLATYGHAHIDLALLSHPHPDHYLGLAGLEAPITELWSAEEPAPDARSDDTGGTMRGDTGGTMRGDASAVMRGDANGVMRGDAPAARVTDEPRTPRDEEKRASRRASPLPSFAAVAAALVARGTRIVHPPLGLARSAAGVELRVWAPRYQPTAETPPRCAADPVRTVNDNSLVVTVRYHGRTLLFAGDVEAEGEAELVSAGLSGVDVVKVPHHGSPTSSTPPFVAATHPRLAVISCGPANHFGFPAPAVLDRWRAAGADLARTDLSGAITVTIGSDGALTVDRFAR